MEKKLILNGLDFILSPNENKIGRNMYFPESSAVTALARSANFDEVSIEAILKLKKISVYCFLAFLEVFNDGIVKQYDFSEFLQQVKYKFLGLKSNDQSSIARFLFLSKLDWDKYGDIIDVIAESKSILVKRQMIKLLDDKKFPKYSQYISELISAGVRDAVHAAVNRFEAENLLDKYEIIMDYFTKRGLDHNDWLLRKFVLRLSEIDDRYAEISKFHWPTYVYICAKIGKDIPDEECIDNYLKSCKMPDNMTSLMIWSYGKLKKTSVIIRLSELIDDDFIENAEMEFSRRYGGSIMIDD